MNRAWIPAGALAGVSVAGLLALGPLTDSLGTKVKFSPSAAPLTQPARVPSSVAVSIVIPGASGKTVTAALAVRGGKAKPAPSASSSEGLASLKVNPGTATAHAPAAGSTSSHTAAPPATATPKKIVKRQTSIDGVGETNPDVGLTGGSNKTSQGEQSVTPGSSGP